MEALIPQITQLINNTLSPDNNLVSSATESLDRLSTLPEFPFALLSITAGGENRGEKILKNFVRREGEGEGEKISVDFRNQLVHASLIAEPAVLKLLVEAFRIIIVKEFVKENSWPELLPELRNVIQNSDLISGKVDAQWKTINALTVLQSILRPFQYFLNPSLKKEPVPPQLEFIAKEILVPLLLVFHNIVEKVLTVGGGPDLEKVLLLVCKCIYFSKLDFQLERVLSLAFVVISHILETGPGWRLVSPHFSSLLDSAIFPVLVMNDKELTSSPNVTQYTSKSGEVTRENWTMQTPNSTLSSPSTPSSSFVPTDSKLENPNPSNATPSSSTVSRLWRPAAQRNLRNQWMKLVSHKQKWVSASSSGRSHATSLVNAHLSQRYLPSLDLGALKDMPGILDKSCQKLSSRQELCKKNLLSSYKDMVGVVSLMINDSRSMKCFTKRSGASPLLQYSNHSEDSNNDPGDGGGIPVFTFLSIPYHEKLGQELVQMFASELLIKRLIVIELLSISCKEEENGKLSWSNELYTGEFEDLSSSALFCRETHQPASPRINGGEFDFLVPSESNIRAYREVLHVFLTTWLVEVNIDTQRIEDIFIIIGEEMHRSLF